VLLKIVYLLVRRISGLDVLVFRRDGANDAELLVLRHENAVLRRHADRGAIRASRPGVVHRAGTAHTPQELDPDLPVTPATLLAWRRKLAAGKYDTSSRRKSGRPPTVPGIARLVVRLATENPQGGYRRIHD